MAENDSEYREEILLLHYVLLSTKKAARYKQYSTVHRSPFLQIILHPSNLVRVYLRRCVCVCGYFAGAVWSTGKEEAVMGAIDREGSR